MSDINYPLRKKNPVSALIRTGTIGLTDEESINRVKIANTLSFTTNLAILAIAPLIFYYHNWNPAVVAAFVIEFILNCAVIVLNYRKKHLKASFLLYYLQCVVIVYYGMLLGQLIQLDLVVIVLISVAFQIFKRKTHRLFAVVAAVIDLIILEAYYYKYPALSKINVGDDLAFLIHALVLVAVIIIMLIVSTPYVKSNDLKYELKRANSFIKIFTVQITHELRTPLNAIFQIAQLLKKEVKSDEHLKKIEPLIDMSLAASSNTRSIVNNVLDMAQIESGKMETVIKEELQVQSFFTRITDVYKIIAQTEHIRLKLSIETMPTAIESDPLNLNQIITNLLANAIKYSHQDTTVHLKVRKLETEKNKWQLQVINRGPGIPREKLASIFDPFFTNRNAHTEGTGLGLYIVRRKVMSMNGDIQVESQPDGYTTFTVTLPLYVPKTKPITTAVEEKKWESDTVDLRNMHVLIAEDHKLSALILFMHLDKLGCKVTTVKNGWELLQTVERNPPDVIIMDYEMPIMNGEETTRKLKQAPSLKHIPIIVSTGNLYSDALDKMLDAGADTYIEKPINIQSLQKVISRYLTQKK